MDALLARKIITNSEISIIIFEIVINPEQTMLIESSDGEIFKILEI